MKNLIKTSVIGIALAASVASCSHNSDTANQNLNGDTATSLVKSIIQTNNNGDTIALFTYDANRNLSNGSWGIFNWTPSSLVVTNFENDDTLAIHTRNSAGYITSQGIYNCNYNSENRLISFRYEAYSSIATLTWNNGNLISLEGDSNYNSISSIEYYTDKIEKRDFGLKYFPYLGIVNFYIGYNMSKNLPKKVTREDGTWDFTYEFDNNGRVTRVNVSFTNAQGTELSTYDFTYFD